MYVFISQNMRSLCLISYSKVCVCAFGIMSLYYSLAWGWHRPYGRSFRKAVSAEDHRDATRRGRDCCGH